MRVADIAARTATPVVVDDWQLDDPGLAAQIALAEAEHVLVIPFGENAWQVRLEHFLLTHAQLTERLAAANDHLLSLNWRLHEIVLCPV